MAEDLPEFPGSAFGDSNNKDLVLRFSPDSTLKSWTLATTFPDEKKKLDPTLQP